MTEDSWEARMAARAKRRASETEVRVEQYVSPWRSFPQAWLNGYPRSSDGRFVTIGNASHCVCCGYVAGIFTIAITEEYLQQEFPPTPQWPFGVGDCPLNPGGKPRHAWNLP